MPATHRAGYRAQAQSRGSRREGPALPAPQLACRGVSETRPFWAPGSRCLNVGEVPAQPNSPNSPCAPVPKYFLSAQGSGLFSRVLLCGLFPAMFLLETSSSSS